MDSVRWRRVRGRCRFVSSRRVDLDEWQRWGLELACGSAPYPSRIARHFLRGVAGLVGKPSAHSSCTSIMPNRERTKFGAQCRPRASRATFEPLLPGRRH
jgi:hypothetical protein